VLRSNENKSCMRVDESWLDIIAQTSKYSRLNQWKKVWKIMDIHMEHL
jgi:hypothetical protein